MRQRVPPQVGRRLRSSVHPTPWQDKDGEEIPTKQPNKSPHARGSRTPTTRFDSSSPRREKSGRVGRHPARRALPQTDDPFLVFRSSPPMAGRGRQASLLPSSTRTALWTNISSCACNGTRVLQKLTRPQSDASNFSKYPVARPPPSPQHKIPNLSSIQPARLHQSQRCPGVQLVHRPARITPDLMQMKSDPPRPRGGGHRQTHPWP